MDNHKLREAVESCLEGALAEMTTGSYEKVIADLMTVIDANVVDASNPDDYPTHCAYCGRPAETRYG